MKKLIRKISIRTKLIMGFGMMALLLFVVGYLGKLSMDNVYDRFEIIMENNVNNIQSLHMMKEEFLNITSEVQKGVLYEDNEKTKSAIKAIEIYQAENQIYIDSYAGRLETDNERQIWNEFLSDLEKYREVRSKTLDLALEGNYEEAKKELNVETSIRETMFASLDNLISDNELILEQKNDKMSSFIRSSAIFM